jgi:hypothetical protein
LKKRASRALLLRMHCVLVTVGGLQFISAQDAPSISDADLDKHPFPQIARYVSHQDYIRGSQITLSPNVIARAKRQGVDDTMTHLMRED